MAKKFVCPECGEEILADRMTRLVEMVSEHAQEMHSMDLEDEQIREGVEDT